MLTLHWRDIERTASVHLGVIQIGFGTTIIAGGPERFPTPTYSALLSAANGQVWPYGFMSLLVGFLLVVPHCRVNYLGHWAGVVSMNVLAAFFFVSMVQDSTAASTAWWAYFSFGTIHGFNAALYMVRRKRHMYPKLEGDGRRGD